MLTASSRDTEQCSPPSSINADEIAPEKLHITRDSFFEFFLQKRLQFTALSFTLGLPNQHKWILR
jgi:hypothetical protein